MASRQTSTSTEITLIPTTDKIAKFRILVVGRTGTGKSSLINVIFKASLTDVQDNQAGTADIKREITSKHNQHLILHDSLGYEPGDEDKFNILKDFILERTQKGLGAEALHAIWLCIPVPYANSRFLEKGDEKIFNLNRNKVPIIVVFTKFDCLLAPPLNSDADEEIQVKSPELAAKEFEAEYHLTIKKFTKGQVPYVLVSTMQPDTLKQLVAITMDNIRIEVPSTSPGLRFRNPFNKNPKTVPPTASEEDLSDSAQIALATAQRVDMPAKIQASIKVGKKKYWRAIISGAHFFGVNIQKCLNVIHKDIITVWNFRGLDEYFLGDIFRARMTRIVSDLNEDNNASSIRGAFATAGAAAGLVSTIAASAAAGPAAPIVAPVAAVVFIAAWAYGIYEKSPANIRCLMGYVVDLTLILQAIFRVSLEDREQGIVTRDRVKDIVDKFDQSDKKKEIHDAIKGFVQNQFLFAKADVVQKIESLIGENRDFFI